MQVVLFLDTSDNKQVKMGLTIDGKKQLVTKPLDTRKAQVALPLLEQLMKENNLTLKDITQIKVNEGPGSFTGLRVGITIANTLGYLLNIPVNGKEAAEPVY